MTSPKTSRILILIFTAFSFFFISIQSSFSQNDEYLEEPTPLLLIPFVPPMSYGADTKLDMDNGNSLTFIRYGAGGSSKNYFQYWRFLDFGLGVRSVGGETDLRKNFTLVSVQGLSSSKLRIADGEQQSPIGYWMVGAKVIDHDESGFREYKNVWVGVDVSYTLNKRDYYFDEEINDWAEYESDDLRIIGQINPYVQWVSFEYGDKVFDDFYEIKSDFYRDLEIGIQGKLGFRVGNRFRFLVDGKYSAYINYRTLRETNYGCEINYSLVASKNYYGINQSGIDFFSKFTMEEIEFEGKTKSIPSIGLGLRYTGFLNKDFWNN
jgi:hypothetical protein